MVAFIKIVFNLLCQRYYCRYFKIKFLGIRNKVSKVNLLISNKKNIILKAPAWVNTFKKMCPLKFTKNTVLTRWGTCLKVAFYYGKNFNNEGIEEFTPEDISCFKYAHIGS